MNTVDYEPNKDDAFQKQFHETGYGFAVTMCEDVDLSDQFAKSDGRIGGKVKEFCETFAHMMQGYQARRHNIICQ